MLTVSHQPLPHRNERRRTGRVVEDVPGLRARDSLDDDGAPGEGRGLDDGEDGLDERGGSGYEGGQDRSGRGRKGNGQSMEREGVTWATLVSMEVTECGESAKECSGVGKKGVPVTAGSWIFEVVVAVTAGRVSTLVPVSGEKD